MAEIKSTLEMVLARAEAMCTDAPDLEDDAPLHGGMKFAASFVNGDAGDISEKFSTLAAEVIPKFAQGMLKTFFRFIVLPRDDRHKWQEALRGIHDVATLVLPLVPADLENLLSEVRALLSRYPDHRKQLKSQLEEAFAGQTAQLTDSMAKQTGMKMNITPDQHPKFNEEWSKVQEQLNGQYNNALDQYKPAIEQIFRSSE